MTHPYNRLSYGQSLPHSDPIVVSETLGVPLRLRPIAGTEHRDACGLYPLSPDLRQPAHDALLAELRALNAVSLVLISDPLDPQIPGGFDFTRSYKPHHVIDPGIGSPKFSKHHRAEVRRAQRHCTARRINLAAHLEQFIKLYEVLILRHGLGMQHRFGPEHFAHLAAHPEDFPTTGAFVDGRLVSAHIWVRSGVNVYSHLAASNAEGYSVGAAYAVYDCAIQSFVGCRITLGGSPDASRGTEADTGLDRFKRGFANATSSPYLCGIIADRPTYDALCAPALAAGAMPEFFPCYRSLPAD